MKNLFLTILLALASQIISIITTHAQSAIYLSPNDLTFLKDLTKEVMDSSRILPNQRISEAFGGNSTGGVLIRPGGRDCYPSFWIRDYAMSLESGMVTKDEQKHMLQLTASTQCDQTWISSTGSFIPAGAIADHIRIDDSKPIYYPGTYDYETQGGKTFGVVPPYGDQYFFIHMAYYYFKSTGSTDFLLQEINGSRLIDRLEMAYKVPPTKLGGSLVYTTDDFRGVDFGFRDVINITGELCFTSILKYRASVEMAALLELLDKPENANNYKSIAQRLKTEIPKTFSDERGMLQASTGKSKQADVWSTALAVYFGILEEDELEKTCKFLSKAYKNGLLSYKGNIRHVLTSDDFNESSAWEVSLAKKETYQNGAYWGTPTGWVCHAIAKVDLSMAQQLAAEYIEDLRLNDFRKGPAFNGPYECFHALGNEQNPVYLTSVTCPYAVFK